MKLDLLIFSTIKPNNGNGWVPRLVLLGCIILIFIMGWQLYTSTKSTSSQRILNQDLQTEILNLKKQYNAQQKLQSEKLTLLNESETKNENPNTFLHLQVNYINAEDLLKLIKNKENSLLSINSKVIFDSKSNSLWVEDRPDNLKLVKRFVSTIDIPKKQVIIEARIVNIAKDAAEDLGVRLGALQSRSEGEKRNFNFDLGALPLDATPASLGLALAKLGKNVLLDLELSALQSEGRAQVISSPRLVTTNNEPAIIESGEDIPYQKFTATGGTSVAFKKAVLSLKVVPKITFNGKLILAISISQDSDSGRRVQGVPIISTKSIETTVMIDDNHTLVLGGIYKQDKNNSIISVPFLGSLPVVGNLFRRTEMRHRNEELLIFITPKVLVMK